MYAVLIGKLAIAAIAAAATWLLLRWRGWDAIDRGRFPVWAVSLVAINRFAIFALVFGVLQFSATSDVVVYYNEALQVLAGKIPFRTPEETGFFTAYAPLFPFLAAIPVALWNDPKAIILLSILIELVSIPFWVAVGRRAYDENVVRKAVIVYACSPLAQLTTPLAGQNHIWLSLFLAVSLWFAFCRRDIASGLAFSLGIATVKWLSLVHAPVVWMYARSKLRWSIATLFAPILVYGFWMSNGWDVFVNLRFHALDFSSGNLPYMATLFGADFQSPSFKLGANLLGLAALVSIFSFVALRVRAFSELQVLMMLAAITFTLLLVSKKSFTSYLLLTYFPLCLFWVHGKLTKTWLLTLLAFSALAGMEPSMWFSMMRQNALNVIWSGSPDVSLPAALIFLAAEILLLGGYAFYLARLVASTLRSD